MIYRSLLTSALILGSISALAPTVLAQTVDIPFSGTVQGICSFGTPTSGILAVEPPTNPTGLAAGYPGAAYGQVSVTCNQPARLSVSKPIQTGGPIFSPEFSTGYVNSPVGNTDSDGAVPLALPSGSIPLSIDMKVRKNSPLQPGNYSYKVTLTITL